MKFILLVLLVSSLSLYQAPEPFNYENMGADWPGTCGTGKRQSPININDGINTVDDLFGEVEFDYKISQKLTEQIKAAASSGAKVEYDALNFNGHELLLESEIGSMIFKHGSGQKEYFNANKITFHYPSEHYITHDGQTPRYAVEMQIEHNLAKADDVDFTEKTIKVKKAIVSILFVESALAPSGDAFLSRLGIDSRRKQADGSFSISMPGEDVTFPAELIKRGSAPPGFDIDALTALRNLINVDHAMYRYYGSETQPPCSEIVEWFVFQKPRSIDSDQVEYFKAQLAHKREDPVNAALINVNPLAGKYYGNNREVKYYDDNANGKIFAMDSGISKIEGMPIPKI